MSTRYHDLKQLEEEWKNADSQEEREKIDALGYKLAHESEETEEMREELISAHKAGNIRKEKEIHKLMKRKETHQNVR